MTCSRCNAEAVVKRGAAAYCAKCALARDWEEIVLIVQEDRVDVAPPAVDFDETPDSAEPAEEPPAKPKKKVKASASKADPDTNGELAADPFA